MIRPGLTYEEFCERRDQRLVLAQRAAQGLRDGDWEPARRGLSAWRFAAAGALAGPLLLRLAQTPLRPAQGAPRRASTAPPFNGRAPERAWRREQELRGAQSALSDPLEWALEHLIWLGEEVQRLERDAWAQHPYAIDLKLDLEVGALWAAWFAGDLARVWRGWERLFWKPARKNLAYALRARRVPEQERPRIFTETREAFFSLFLGAQGGPQGWREVAVRVVEGGGSSGPVEALAELVDPGLWTGFFTCATRRQPWRSTLQKLLPDPLEAEFGLSWVQTRSRNLDALLDLHVAWRLIRAWSQPEACGVDATWHILEHHRARVRGRLRALVREQPGAQLRDALLRLEGLNERTARAVGAYLWTWAQQELSVRFAVVPRVVTPACVVPAAPSRRSSRAQSPEILAVERCWVLLGLLRGQGERIRLYSVHQVQANGSFGELLNLLPDRVADPDSGHRRTWKGLRRSLREHLPLWEDELRPVLGQIAALPTAGRALKALVRELLRPHWHPDLPLPAGAYPGMVRAARAWLEAHP